MPTPVYIYWCTEQWPAIPEIFASRVTPNARWCYCRSNVLAVLFQHTNRKKKENVDVFERGYSINSRENAILSLYTVLAWGKAGSNAWQANNRLECACVSDVQQVRSLML